MARELAEFDGCECGDYRFQHSGPSGQCIMPNDLTHGFERCLGFRLWQPAPEIPEFYRKIEAKP